MRAPVVMAAALQVLTGTASGQTLETSTSACRTLEGLRDYSSKRETAEALKASGECLSVPAGTAFWVERWSAAAPCIRISGFDQCLWMAAPPPREE